MLKLFKAKSLKKTREIEQGADNKNAKKQRGRSMVEMLGVLAIIGVLSIGGIQGYTMAMRRYRANEVLDLVNKYAVMVYTSCQKQISEGNSVIGDQRSRPAGIYTNSDLGVDYWLCNRLPFTDSGLGPVPEGLKAIGTFWDFESDADIVVDGSGSGPGATIVSFSSGDIVTIGLAFNDRDLCETISSITGGSGADSVYVYNDGNPCNPENTYSYGGGVIYPLNAVISVNN